MDSCKPFIPISVFVSLKPPIICTGPVVAITKNRPNTWRDDDEPNYFNAQTNMWVRSSDILYFVCLTHCTRPLQSLHLIIHVTHTDMYFKIEGLWIRKRREMAGLYLSWSVSPSQPWTGWSSHHFSYSHRGLKPHLWCTTYNLYYYTCEQVDLILAGGHSPQAAADGSIAPVPPTTTPRLSQNEKSWSGSCGKIMYRSLVCRDRFRTCTSSGGEPRCRRVGLCTPYRF